MHFLPKFFEFNFYVSLLLEGLTKSNQTFSISQYFSPSSQHTATAQADEISGQDAETSSIKPISLDGHESNIGLLCTVDLL